uniref:Wsv292 n=1 Tax=White spot syndrome virus TaxID=92652 RepID=A0A2U9G8D3_WSSV|nr:wsv292 [Shrimp white spot syndrome virus]AWQ60868.1 wsv292 [Shrimp white spot syndrome virus]AWQ61286.1 wsv292 [Shrimp white spot syndrome virus]AWQ62167.1 wsv292 [Shrimp white spot syndrome virus]AWQ62541.1 wsv292 [Shrimp white spot syndrome virus]
MEMEVGAPEGTMLVSVEVFCLFVRFLFSSYSLERVEDTSPKDFPLDDKIDCAIFSFCSVVNEAVEEEEDAVAVAVGS